MLFCGYAWSNESSDHKPITQKDSSANQKKNQSGFDTTSLEKTIREAIKEATEKPDPNAQEKLDSDRKLAEYTGQLADFTKWLVIVTSVLAFVAIWQGVMLKQTIGLTREEFIATHRPKIRVRNFAIYPGRIGIVSPNIDFAWGFSIFNAGDSAAEGIDLVYAVSWSDNPSEAIEEFETGPQHHSINFAVSPGEVVKHSIPHNVHNEPDAAGIIPIHVPRNTKFFVVGRIGYKDKAGVKRNTGFIRECEISPRITPGIDSFRKLENVDYEYED